MSKTKTVTVVKWNKEVTLYRIYNIEQEYIGVTSVLAQLCSNANQIIWAL
jgi:hypothetical protein